MKTILSILFALFLFAVFDTPDLKTSTVPPDPVHSAYYLASKYSNPTIKTTKYKILFGLRRTS